MSYFEGCTNVVINNSVFSDGGQLDGIQYLASNIASGATHNAGERYPPPQCYPGTREDVLSLLMGRCEASSLLALLIWVYGSAGVGKSAIAQTTAQKLEALGLPVATFFFSRTDPSRNVSNRLFSTIAYQLAIAIPVLKEHISSTIMSDPSILTQSMEHQMGKLIVEPLQACKGSLNRRIVIIIDGLDECLGEDSQRSIINLVLGVIRQNLPVNFIITSRPEPAISALLTPDLDKTPTLDVSKPPSQVAIEAQVDDEVVEDWDVHSVASEDQAEVDDGHLYTPSFLGNEPHICLELQHSRQVDEEIRSFLMNRFQTIREDPELRHQFTDVPPQWPAKGDVDLLVRKASGQFIYASTVLKHVKDPYFRPTSQLAQILTLDGSNSGASDPLADLNVLYLQIIRDAHPDPARLAEPLSLLLVMRHSYPTLDVIDQLLSLEHHETFRVLRGLHSLVFIPKLGETDYVYDEDYPDPTVPQHHQVRFYHATFSDFLTQSARAHPFHINIAQAHASLVMLCMTFLRKNQHSYLNTDQGDRSRQSPASFALRYSLERWRCHLAEIFNPSVPLPVDVLSSVHTCTRTFLGSWFDFSSYPSAELQRRALKQVDTLSGFHRADCYKGEGAMISRLVWNACGKGVINHLKQSSNDLEAFIACLVVLSALPRASYKLDTTWTSFFQGLSASLMTDLLKGFREGAAGMFATYDAENGTIHVYWSHLWILVRMIEQTQYFLSDLSVDISKLARFVILAASMLPLHDETIDRYELCDGYYRLIMVVLERCQPSTDVLRSLLVNSEIIIRLSICSAESKRGDYGRLRGQETYALMESGISQLSSLRVLPWILTARKSRPSLLTLSEWNTLVESWTPESIFRTKSPKEQFYRFRL